MRFKKLVSLFLWIAPLYGQNEEPPQVGNFSLPTSQQPSILLSFGQLMIGKGVTQLYCFDQAIFGTDNHSNTIDPGIIMGIRDDLTIYFYLPISTGNYEGSLHSAGVMDLAAMVEYAFYNTSNSKFYDQATVLTGIFFPTGSATKNPPTGNGSPSYFLGTTFGRYAPYWDLFFSPGFLFTSYKSGIKYGNTLFYNVGGERYMKSPPGWIFALLLEFDGYYYWKDSMNGTRQPNSGGNIVWMMPSFWASSLRTIWQFGIGYPVIQHWKGDQPNDYLSIAFNFTLTL